MAHCLGWKHEVATHISGLLQMCNAILLVMRRRLRCGCVHHSTRNPAKAEKP